MRLTHDAHVMPAIGSVSSAVAGGEAAGVGTTLSDILPVSIPADTPRGYPRDAHHPKSSAGRSVARLEIPARVHAGCRPRMTPHRLTMTKPAASMRTIVA